ncbi:MAG: toll/interleukin-1 receptor domain-containing protein [Candidatus Marinimicrobia bacterium]|nr:toll/interleukin-1 receptor domain-containing protein [Candidatus Neomarinimicrobiota bacterium]
MLSAILNVLPLNIVVPYCIFSAFVFYQQLHASRFEGASRVFLFVLTLMVTIGFITGLTFLVMYGIRILAAVLAKRFDVWYADYKLVVGASLMEEISKGLAAADYGVVVLSRHFFAKKWPQRELNGLFTVEEASGKVVLPIWKDVTEADVRVYSPILADRVAVMASQGVEAVANAIERSIEYFDIGKTVQRGSPALTRLTVALGRKAAANASDQIIRTEKGVALVNAAAKHFVERAIEIIEALLSRSPKSDIRVGSSQLQDHHSYVDVRSGRTRLRFEYENEARNSATEARLDCAVFNGHLGPYGNYEGADVLDREQYAPVVTSDNLVHWRNMDGKQFSEDSLIEEWFSRLTKEIEERQA